MADYKDSWKSKEVFEQQLSLNKKQLDGAYPEHWKVFLSTMRANGVKFLLDIGCGCGAYYQLCKKELPNLFYAGVDYSQEAIDIALREFPDGYFFCASLDVLTDVGTHFITHFDMVHAGALFDVLPDGDEQLSRVLALQPKKLFVGRMSTTAGPDSYCTEYMAYDRIMTYRYVHSVPQVSAIAEFHGYDMHFESPDNVLFTHR
jgi:trans-aconitate methyltransferase